jgi:hypothetical protein
LDVAAAFQAGSLTRRQRCQALLLPFGEAILKALVAESPDAGQGVRRDRPWFL